MVWFIAVIFLIITIILISGKGAFLIAGCNTSSKAEKLKYDEKKLCRVMGSGTGIITLFLILLACFGDNPPNWMLITLPIVIITVTTVMLILCNTICKAENISATEVTAEESKTNRRILIVTLIITAAILCIIGIMLFTGQIETTVEGDSIKIAGSYWTDYSVQLDKIKSISCVDGLEVGNRTNGLGSFKLLEGNFRNNQFGDYILYAYLKCDNYIVIDTYNGILVINAETEQETESLYQMLKNKVEAYQ